MDNDGERETSTQSQTEREAQRGKQIKYIYQDIIKSAKVSKQEFRETKNNGQN